MKEFDFNFENIDEKKSLSIKERIIDSLPWHTFDIKKIHLETEDDEGKKYKKMIIEW